MGYIVRVDKPKNEPSKGTHGWQVRGAGKRGYHSKLFSDNIYGSKGKALIAAEEYLAEYIEANSAEATVIPSREQNLFPQGFYTGGKMWANNKSGVTGVFRTHDYGRWDTDKKRKQYYWGAFYTINRYGKRKTRGHQKFYVDEWGEEEAKRRAIEFRQMWEEAAREGVEAVKRFFEEYRAGWLK
jgi:hypothetical protein